MTVNFTLRNYALFCRISDIIFDIIVVISFKPLMKTLHQIQATSAWTNLDEQITSNIHNYFVTILGTIQNQFLNQPSRVLIQNKTCQSWMKSTNYYWL